MLVGVGADNDLGPLEMPDAVAGLEVIVGDDLCFVWQDLDHSVVTKDLPAGDDDVHDVARTGDHTSDHRAFLTLAAVYRSQPRLVTEQGNELDLKEQIPVNDDG